MVGSQQLEACLPAGCLWKIQINTIGASGGSSSKVPGKSGCQSPSECQASSCKTQWSLLH